MKSKLWTHDYTKLFYATTLGSIASIMAQYALTFLVFNETKSTLLASLTIAIRLIPKTLIPLCFSPLLDRFPRKPFLVLGDFISGIIYLLMGLYLLNYQFSYIAYLVVSFILSIVTTLDEMAYNAIYPTLIEKGMEQKGYSVSSLLYSTVSLIALPVAAIIYTNFGVSYILLLQALFSILASIIESRIRKKETIRKEEGKHFSFSIWWSDLVETLRYLKREKGLKAIYIYMSLTSGSSYAQETILVAFFSVTAGFTPMMYPLLSFGYFIGRTVGGIFSYIHEISSKKRFKFAFIVYNLYSFFDIILLYSSYPIMVFNRAFSALLGVNSATLRNMSVQTYIPDELRSKLNSFETALTNLSYFVFSLLIGAMGEIVDLKLAMALCGIFSLFCLYSTIGIRRKDVKKIYSIVPTKE